MRPLIALIAGVVFAVGLALAGMTQPSKVLGFLDVTGAWDPTLLFVMGGAVTVFAAAHQVSRRMTRPLFAPEFARPASTRIDPRLLLGAALFGVGWGLAGYCPGPALASLGAGGTEVGAFVAAMIVGAALVQVLDARTR